MKTHASSICLADVQVYRKGYYAKGKPLITATFSLEDIEAAFEEASGSPICLKVVIKP